MHKKVTRIIPAALLFASGMMALAGCGDSAAPTATPTSAPSQPTATTAQVAPTQAPMQKVTIALGYIPDVQFAPFYVALNNGYYKDEGLEVTLQNGIAPDLIKTLGEGSTEVNFAVVSGDELIPARLQGIPVKYVMTWYRQYPVAAVAIEGKGPTLKSPADLKGKKVGVPGPYGSTYTGLLALLKAGGLTLNDIQMESIGFTQVASLTAEQVEVAMVYAANEPTQLTSQGLNVTTLRVADYAKLASNGLATNEKTLNGNPELVAKVVRATLKGINETIANPDAAFESALKQVPEAGGKNKDLQMQVLKETVKLMQPNPNDPSMNPVAVQPGFIEQGVWETTQDFLLDAKIITAKGNVTDMFTNQFVLPTNN